MDMSECDVVKAGGGKSLLGYRSAGRGGRRCVAVSDEDVYARRIKVAPSGHGAFVHNRAAEAHAVHCRVQLRYVDALAVTEDVKVFREAHRRIRRVVGRGVMVAGGKEKAAVGIAAYHAGDELYAVAGDIFAVEQVAGYEAELRALLLGVQHGGRERGTQLHAALFSFARRAERKRGIKMNVGKMEDFDHNSSRLAVQ